MTALTNSGTGASMLFAPATSPAPGGPTDAGMGPHPLPSGRADGAANSPGAQASGAFRGRLISLRDQRVWRGVPTMTAARNLARAYCLRPGEWEWRE